MDDSGLEELFSRIMDGVNLNPDIREMETSYARLSRTKEEIIIPSCMLNALANEKDFVRKFALNLISDLIKRDKTTSIDHFLRFLYHPNNGIRKAATKIVGRYSTSRNDSRG